MQDLTLVIPAKYERVSTCFLNEISDLKCKKLIVLENTDIATINAIKNFEKLKSYFKNKGYG